MLLTEEIWKGFVDNLLSPRALGYDSWANNSRNIEW